MPPPPLSSARDLDLLFVIESGGYLTPEQTALARSMPQFFEATASRFDSIHVGVITMNMGSGGFTVPGCEEPNFGDDGILVVADPSCLASGENFSSATTAADLAEEAACLVMVGTDGCGLEQPLESMLKAVAPSTVSRSGAFDAAFNMATPGHADGANAGFLRDDAHLAIVVLAEEDDCSLRDPELAYPDSDAYTGDLNTRCLRYPEAVMETARYVDGLLAAKDPRRLSYMVIAGIPTDLAGRSYPDIIGDPRMVEEIDPSMPTRLRPVCNTSAGLAFPARRLLETGWGLELGGVDVSFQSSCQSDLATPIEALIEQLTF